jgi:hypothetical protein
VMVHERWFERAQATSALPLIGTASLRSARMAL